MFDQMKQLKQLMSMLGDAGQMKERMEKVQAELAGKTVEADAGAGAVRVVVNGKFEVVKLELDPVMLTALAGQGASGGAETDKAMVEDLILAAVNEGLRRAQEMVRETMIGEMGLGGLGGLSGLNLPGL